MRHSVKTTNNFVFFWGAKDVFSNWHAASFHYKGNTFSNVEQFMMYGKAKLFGDEASAEELLKTSDPKKCKAIGRGVEGFKESIWNAKCEAIVSIGCREKFLQNPDLLEHLLSTEGRVIVEASPYDKIWGIGLKDDHPDATNPNRWRGENRLGNVIIQVRDSLICGYADQNLPERAQVAMESAMSALELDNEDELGPSPG
jgi:hypothetical protein